MKNTKGKIVFSIGIRKGKITYGNRTYKKAEKINTFI